MFMHEPIFGLLYGLQIFTIVEGRHAPHVQKIIIRSFKYSCLVVDTFLNEVAAKPRESNANVRQQSP
jgi:hypothetical protein